MGSDSAFGEPYYGDALRQDNEQKWSALADARRRAEEALAFMDAALRDEMPPLPTQVKALADAVRALLAAGPEAKAPGHDRIAELESLLRECNAVCLCGCPDSEHEADECGESCGHDNHECIRVAPAVLDYVNRLRSRPLPPGVEAAAEALRYELDEVVRDLTYATLNTRHVRTVLSYLSSARGAKGGAE